MLIRSCAKVLWSYYFYKHMFIYEYIFILQFISFKNCFTSLFFDKWGKQSSLSIHIPCSSILKVSCTFFHSKRTLKKIKLISGQWFRQSRFGFLNVSNIDLCIKLAQFSNLGLLYTLLLNCLLHNFPASLLQSQICLLVPLEDLYFICTFVFKKLCSGF